MCAGVERRHRRGGKTQPKSTLISQDLASSDWRNLEIEGLGISPGPPWGIDRRPPPVQVACSCLERGHALSQLWAVLRYILKAAMADRDMAWEMSREAGRREAGNLEGMRALSARLQVRSPSWGVGAMCGRASPVSEAAGAVICLGSPGPAVLQVPHVHTFGQGLMLLWTCPWRPVASLDSVRTVVPLQRIPLPSPHLAALFRKTRF